MSKKNSTKIVPLENGNTVKSSQAGSAKHWGFTLNNYTELESSTEVPEFLNEICTKWVFGFEVGKKEHTPHLQGYVELKKRTRLTALKKYNERIHWEKSRNHEALKEYCCKDGNIMTNIRFKKLGKWNTIIWKPWQQEIIDIIKTEPNDRTVNWYWETEGATGKSFLTKYLVEIHGALVVNGKLSDICHQVAKRCELEQKIGIVVFDIPRCSKGLLSYQAIEMLKNGLIYSGKYEGGQYTFDSPHVIVFANEHPDKNMLSPDRWNIKEVV